jgi:serine protein kinase
MNYIGALAVSGKMFDYKSNERLHRALEMKLFEDLKDSIKLSSLVSSVVDKETQEKIDIVKSRMINNYTAIATSAPQTCSISSQHFARGDVKKEVRR